MIRLVRLYTGDDGQSHVSEEQVELAADGHDLVSKWEHATGIRFEETPPHSQLDWHYAPRRQYVVNLEGGVEIEVGDGTKRILGTGDILLAEDTTGQGHISRAVAGKPRRSLFITLD